MPPPNPKRPPRPGPPPDAGPVRRKPTTEVDLPFDRPEDLPFDTADADLPFDTSDVDLPFDTSEVTPLRVDDPTPQRVAQYPATRSRRPKPADQVPTEVLQIPGELTQSFGGTKTQETFRPVFLYVERGPGAGQLVPVGQGPFVMGRSSTADLRLQHPSISRRHAELTRRGERFFLKDLGSQNGTFVNKARLLAEREIFAGDTLALGTAVLKLRGPMSQGAGDVTGTHSAKRGGLKLALFALAVVFGLASMLLYAVLRSPGQAVSSGKVALSGPGPVAPVGPKGPIVAMPELRHAEVTPPQHTPPPIAPASPVRTAPSPATHRAPPSRAKASAKKSHAATPRPERVRHAAPQHEVDVADATPREVDGPPADRAALNAYREGELADALRLAKGSLATRLVYFQAEYTAGRRALADHDATTASAHFRKALEVDRTLAGGDGTFNGILRHELEELKTLESAESASPRARKTSRPKAPAARDAIDAAFGD